MMSGTEPIPTREVVTSPYGPVDVRTGELLRFDGASARGVDDRTPGAVQVMSRAVAGEVTEAIRSTSELLYVLLAHAHAGKAWLALGYASFEEYVRAEFDMSRSRAYQILDQARVIQALEAALPASSERLVLSEAATRDLKRVLPQMLDAIERRLADTTSRRSQQDIDDLIDEFRANARALPDRRRPEERRNAAEPRLQVGPLRSEGVGDRRFEQAAFDLCASLGALGAMPEVVPLIDHIPADRQAHISEVLSEALGWLEEFAEVWRSRHLR